MVANVYEVTGLAAIDRMRKRFGEDLTKPDAPIGVRSAFVGGVTVKSGGPTTINVTAWATTDAVDMDREVVLPEGCDWVSYFGANGKTLFVDHCYGVSYRVGYARALPTLKRTPSGGLGWLLTGVIRTDTMNPNAQAVVDGAKDGRIGMSIGFEALEWGDPTPEERTKYRNAESIVRKCKILEVSYTYMPCNVECQTQAVTVDEAKALELATLKVKGVLPKTVSDRFVMPEQPKRKIVVLTT